MSARPKARENVVKVTAPKGSTKSSVVKFGAVTITGSRPSADEVKLNIGRSTIALDRVAKKLAKPGVRIRPKKDVPLFFVDPENPDLIVRKLNGELTRGVLEGGVFKVRR